MTDDLVTWLRAQLDEDERVARAAGSRLDGSYEWVAGEANADGVRTKAGTPVTRFSWPNEMEHIARHDPARVLREVAAKRAIVKLHEQVPATPRRGQENPPATGCHWCNEWDGLTWAGGVCDTVRLLASAYSDQPGYREEWRP